MSGQNLFQNDVKNPKYSDKIQIVMMDSAYNPYYKNRADVTDLKAMIQIFKDLEHHGLDLKKILRDSDGEILKW